MSYILVSENKGLFGVLDTKDNVTEYYNRNGLIKFLKSGVKIKGASYRGTLITNCQDMRTYFLRLQFLGTPVVILDESDTLKSAKRKIRNNYCSYLKVVNYSNITDMTGLFERQERDIIDLSNFDVSKVTKMTEMFKRCEVNELCLNGWDTSNVTRMDSMFEKLRITELDLNNLDMSNVCLMENMFCNARVPFLHIENWKIGKASMYNMFCGFTTMGDLDLHKWDMSDVLNVDYMFYSADIENLNINNWDIRARGFGTMFEFCSLKTIRCKKVKGLNLKGAHCENVVRR